MILEKNVPSLVDRITIYTRRETFSTRDRCKANVTGRERLTRLVVRETPCHSSRSPLLLEGPVERGSRPREAAVSRSAVIPFHSH